MNSIQNYPVNCTGLGCKSIAAYKIAAEWSDGSTRELKTYSLCCTDCLADQLAAAKRRRESCPLELGESLGIPSVFVMQRGIRDTQLKQRLTQEPEA